MADLKLKTPCMAADAIYLASRAGDHVMDSTLIADSSVTHPR